MKHTLHVLLLSLLSWGAAAQLPAPLKLWYTAPAAKWMEALPVGNGRLGAMVYGHPQAEIIQINEQTLWGGTPYNDANPNSLRVLDSVRSLLFAGKPAAAQQLATPNMVAVNAENSDQLAARFRSYQTLMNLHIRYGDRPISAYKRELDLTTGVAVSRFTTDGVTYTQEVFASAPANVIVVKVKADKPRRLQAVLYLDRPDTKDTLVRYKDATTTVWEGNKLLLQGQIQDMQEKENRGPVGKHMRFAGVVTVQQQGGRLQASGDSLVVTAADELVLFIDGATNYNAPKLSLDELVSPVAVLQQAIKKYSQLRYDQLKAAHIKDHSAFMNRVTFSLADTTTDKPTDARLAAVKQGAYDAHLTMLLFQYGRYLLLGSSRRPGVLPANLQGIWNNHINAPWESDFHTNINLQMNYWQAESGNLPETVAPLSAFMSRIREQGRITARKMYGARGWVMHHATDAFGKTGLQNQMYYGTFPMASAWMCMHLWDHYDFTRNRRYLADTAYPIMHEHALFIKDFLVKGPEGYLVTAPAYSPENWYKDPATGEAQSLTYGPTMDNQIIREFLERYITAAHILKKDVAFADSMQQVMAQLPPTRLGKDGRILEWIKPYEEEDPGHRHISHLFSLYPGTGINAATPALFAGARATLAYRLAHGGGHTGWSRAWIINFYARLKDGEKVFENIQALFRKSIYTNLFDDHPPFQIDGNFGSAAGITEALLQSGREGIELLPALPAAWQEGAIKGIRARGGFEVDIAWKNNRLTRAAIRSFTGEPVTVTYKGKSVVVQPAKGAVVQVAQQLGIQ
ncbi:glycoside hydrolase family 95 protein [Chitinophaga nivalis]|uniref:Glycoside hydrolase family 95 protein n=1 Tax=Chitinophaga nivalis TaxID=2991709 RepID=A0ABT3IFU6_9BACT|nr:glycoside hydrolase family 95 protein [Chitinophaga nivalis]MCW3467474.1 glycoside hydrolase family 95 protein [Chitinophaga nivalis]MCW3482834.1 glycoside hydrolase family 95 protein [Chitinophaga nivalis]